jgi:plasmid stability protein
MAGNLLVGNLDDDLIVRLKRPAARHQRSTEAGRRESLRQSLGTEFEPSFDRRAADLRMLTRGRRQTPSEILQREGRAEP